MSRISVPWEPQTIAEQYIGSSGLVTSRHFLTSDDSTLPSLLSQVVEVNRQCSRFDVNHPGFLSWLLAKDESEALITCGRLSQQWCSENDAVRNFVVGQAYLKAREPDKAMRWMLSAQHGITSQPQLAHIAGINIDEDLTETDFFMKILVLFAESGYSEHVVDLATLALSQIEDGHSSQGLLYSLVFKHRLLLEEYDEAYSAMVANPNVESKLDCLRQLIVDLMDKAQYETLVRFPYNSLENQVVGILESRARSVDLQTRNYYNILYAFHVHRSNYRKAASTMYECSVRFGAEVAGVGGLQGQASALLASMNCLRLVEPQYAWVVRPRSVLKSQQMRDEESLLGIAPSEKDVYREFSVVQLIEMQREHCLVTSRIRLAHFTQNNNVTSGGVWSSEECVRRLASSGLYEQALQVAKAKQVPADGVLSHLATRCIKLSSNATLDKSDYQWLRENPSATVDTDLGIPDQAWELLRRLLTAQTHSASDVGLLRSVAERLLAHNHPLPGWLTTLFKSLNGGQLLYLLVSHGQLESAALLASQMIEAILGSGPNTFNYKNTLHAHEESVWLPISTFDTLLKNLKQHAEYNEVYSSLKGHVDAYVKEATDTARDKRKLAVMTHSTRIL